MDRDGQTQIVNDINHLKTALPTELRALLTNADWQPIQLGMSGVGVYRIVEQDKSMFLKVSDDLADPELRADKAIIQWLRGKLPVPEVLAFAETETHQFLLLSAVPGEDASADHHDTKRLVHLLAEGLRMIHAVDPTGCPSIRPLDVMIEGARRRLENGQVDESDFDDERSGHTAESAFDELVLTRPPIEERVFVHGDYCLPNILIDRGKISGFIDWGRAGIADPYQDLALAERSIIYNIGAKWVRPFFDAYGIADVDWERVRYYKLLDEFY